MNVRFSIAGERDAAEIARVRSAAAGALTERYGPGHWSIVSTERGVLRGIRADCVLVARRDGGIVGTLRLQTKKPWAIPRELLTKVRRTLYLVDMAVDPAAQRRGVGRALLAHARDVAREWPADLIALDAWDAPAGAGGFYASCGYREVGRAVYRGAPLVYYELVIAPERRGA